MNEYVEIVERLNERFLNNDCFDEGLSFVCWDTGSVQSIEFCHLHLWNSEECDFCDEDGEFDKELMYEYCCEKYINLIEMMSAKLKEN